MEGIIGEGFVIEDTFMYYKQKVTYQAHVRKKVDWFTVLRVD